MDARYNTLFLGKVLKEYDILDSTNSEAERLLRKNKLPEGAVILAHKQEQGRGQMGNRWYSEAGKNLTMTVVLYPRLDFPKEQFLLNQMASLAIKDVLDELGLENVMIKWPNDIWVGSRKIAGILIQNSISQKSISQSIIGIGLNINQSHFPEGSGKPTSLLSEGLKVNVKEVLAQLCYSLEKRYLMLKANRKEELSSDYHHHLFRKDKWHIYLGKDGMPFNGRILGVDEMGRLLMDSNEGKKAFNFKEITFTS